MFARQKNDSYMVKLEMQEPKSERYWHSYGEYRVLVWAWLLGDAGVVWAATELAHSGYYPHTAVYVLAVLLVGAPLLYSEICLAQYTGCDALAMWDFFPLFRCVGYGSVFLILMKTVYMTVLTTWYLVYSAHAALSPPPWGSCEEFTAAGAKCMVKRINISIFQNCLEAQVLYGGDCGMKTASRCFFEREIGNHVSAEWPRCLPRWKQTMALWCVAGLLFVLSLKRKFLRTGVKVALVYVCASTFVLVCVALSTTGTWFSASFSFGWGSYDLDAVLLALSKAFLGAGTGTGMLAFLSRGAGLRSPANMTALTAPMLSAFTTLMLGLVTFGGIKTMSYYHGDEENVIEIGSNYFFSPFASMSEIMSYLHESSVWGFVWFSVNFVCMFVNTWLLFTYLRELVAARCATARRHPKSCAATAATALVLLAYPCFCSDLTPAVMDAVDTAQIFSSLAFSVSLYWIYGYYNHSVDIMFMIGVKSSYFWKCCWVVNPLVILCILVTKCDFLAIGEYPNSHKFESLGLAADYLLYVVLVGVYLGIVSAALLATAAAAAARGRLRALLAPHDDWGPRDDVLFKSRKMFVPEIMTREFLYRQVKIHGYKKRNKVNATTDSVAASEAVSCGQSTEWSVLTSN